MNILSKLKKICGAIGSVGENKCEKTRFFCGFWGISPKKKKFSKNKKKRIEILSISYFMQNFRKIGPAVPEISA